MKASITDIAQIHKVPIKDVQTAISLSGYSGSNFNQDQIEVILSLIPSNTQNDTKTESKVQNDALKQSNDALAPMTAEEVADLLGMKAVSVKSNLSKYRVDAKHYDRGRIMELHKSRTEKQNAAIHRAPSGDAMVEMAMDEQHRDKQTDTDNDEAVEHDPTMIPVSNEAKTFDDKVGAPRVDMHKNEQKIDTSMFRTQIIDISCADKTRVPEWLRNIVVKAYETGKQEGYDYAMESMNELKTLSVDDILAGSVTHLVVSRISDEVSINS